MVPDLSLSASGTGSDHHLHGLPPPVLSLSTFGSSSSNMASSAPYYLHQPAACVVSAAGGFLPPWLAGAPRPHPTAVESSAPSVDLSLLPSEQQRPSEIVSGRYFGLQQQTAVLGQLCGELEEGRQNWIQHKKEANWRLSRLEQQLEMEKTRKVREKVEQVKAEIRHLYDEESSSLEQIEAECREQLNAILRAADAKEVKMIDSWMTKHARLTRLLDQLGGPNCFQINKELH